METNNLYGFGGHASESASSGLKLSSGDTLYTNGSSVSFPQTGKNINGDMNVNSIAPVIGTSTSGPHTSTTFSHLSNHHNQSGLGFDCLWGQAPYTPAGMSAGPGSGLHPKQGTGGVMQQQSPPPPAPSQQQFQGHGQYQLNGSPAGSCQSATAPPPSATLPGGAYWGRGSPGTHQGSSAVSCSTYTSYQNQLRLSMASSQHHHQQQQRVQQQQPFGMVNNGVPYYQHQPPHAPLTADQSQAQAPVAAPSLQSFSQRGSPLHQHHLGRAASSSPLPVAPVSLPALAPSAAPENGVSRSRDPSLIRQGVSSAAVQGCLNETYEDMEEGYGAVEQMLSAPTVPEPEVFATQPPAPPMMSLNSYCSPVHRPASDLGQPTSKSQDTGVTVEEPVPPAVLASSALLSEPASQNPNRRAFAEQTGPIADSTVSQESGAPSAKLKKLDVTGTEFRMCSQSETMLEKSPNSCPAASPGVWAAVAQATDGRSQSVKLPVKERGAGGWVDASSSDTRTADESVTFAPPGEPSHVSSTRAVDGHTPEEGSEETFADAYATDDCSVDDGSEAERSASSRRDDVSRADETMDSSSALDDSCDDVSKNDTSQLTVSQGSLQNTTHDHLFANSVSDESKVETELDVPDSAGGSAAFTPGHEHLGGAASRAGHQLACDLVSSLSHLVTSPCDTGKIVGTVPAVYDPQVSKLAQPPVERKRKDKTIKKGRAKVKVLGLGDDTELMENAAKELPAVFKKLMGSEAPLSNSQSLVLVKPKKEKIKKLVTKVPKATKVDSVMEDHGGDDDDDSTGPSGGVQRRRIATEEQVNFPLLHGWRREIRVRKCENRLKGETWYYSPCGKRMKQFPEVIKYLRRHQDSVVTREHFSFSPRMPVGDFYEERETPEGMKWSLLADEEVPSMIMAITGRRGRPPNPDKERPRSRARRCQGGSPRRPGRPLKPKMVDLLSKAEAKLLKRLEAQDTLTEEEKEKLGKIRRKMKRKARIRKQEEAKNRKNRQEKRKAKLDKAKEAKDQEEPSEAQISHQPVQEPKKPGRRKRVKVDEKVESELDRAEDKENSGRGKRAGEARSKAKALAKAQAEAEAQAQAAAAARRQAERRAQAQRRLEERKRQQMILEELKKPTEDMCLTDHQALPELMRVPGVVLSGQAFSHCLMVVEFLHSYGKVLGLQAPRDVPSLCTLQEGLLGLGDSQREVLELLVKLVQAALCDPGLPSYYQSVKILGDKLVDVELNRSSVSEVLRIFLESHAFQADVCKSLRTKPFQALAPDTKASILAFIVDELNASSIVTREIDSTLENMATHRKNKWTIEGKLRKLKAALARKTGRSEDELGLEERRRSARVAEEENQYLEESGFLERGSRRVRRDEAQLSEGESPATASVPELERQIDKLTKRQIFFRKKLLQASHSLRAVSLGQDRYRRRYWVMPHVGGILVEGAEEILASGDVLVKEEPEPVILPVKVEPKAEPPISPTADPSSCQLSSPEADPLPGTASLMSSPRGRGRPRKIKPEVELHLRAAKNRRRRRSSKAGSEESAEASGPERGMQDYTQSAFLSWLSQTQTSLTDGSPQAQSGDSVQHDSLKDMAEKQGQWFNLLPKTPCDASSIAQPPLPASPPKDSLQSPGLPTVSAALPPQSVRLLSDLALSPQVCFPQVCSTPLLKPSRRRRRPSSSGMVFSFPGSAKRRGRPPSRLLQEIEQKYFMQLMVRPIPAAKVRGWWWIRDPEEVKALLHSLHPRGVREKTLHKHLSKHMEFLTEVCSRPISDLVFQQQCEDGSALLQAVRQPWDECGKAMEADVSVLQWVEDLEQRVLAADLQIKMAPQNGPSDTDGSVETSTPGFQGFTAQEPDSMREDLQYHEHDVELLDDWIVRTKREWSDLLRVPTHPLDLAVVRLLRLERNIERRYLKEPLWALGEVVRLAPLTPPPGGENHVDAESLESEITPRVRAWRQAVDRCRSAAQLSLCLLQLERAIAWERSIVKVICLVCRKGDDDEYLLLCDGCDRGCHMYCLRPKVTQVPEGDWFCPICLSKENGDSPRLRRFPKPKSRSRKRHFGGYSSESSDDDDSGYKRRSGMATRRRDSPPVAASSYTRFSGESGGSSSSPAKRRRMTTRNQPDLTYCEIILMEMEAHTDAWPFLEPVNPRLVPGYRRIIKNPMDFLTMRERLLQGGYLSCEDFAADAQLVFNNCQLFNEDTSEVGMAGHSMRRFFESRWAEFYKNKDK